MQKPSRSIPWDGFKEGENDLAILSFGAVFMHALRHAASFSYRLGKPEDFRSRMASLRVHMVATEGNGRKEVRFKGPLYAFTGLKRLCRKDYLRIFPESESHSKRGLGILAMRSIPCNRRAPMHQGDWKLRLSVSCTGYEVGKGRPQHRRRG